MMEILFSSMVLLQFVERTILETESGNTGNTENPFQMLLIVGLALLITLLAKRFSNHGGGRR